MGKIDQIDQLQTYISDLGEEIVRVKKASEYLKLIEEFQGEVKKGSSSLEQSNKQLQLIQKVIESKLDLYQTTTKNLESKQQAIEQSQNNIIKSLEELKQQQVRNEKGLVASFKDMNKLINNNNKVIGENLEKVKEDQLTYLKAVNKTNKIFFGINVAISLSILGILIYTLSA